MTAQEFGLYLKGLRENRKLTIRQVEMKTGISNSYLSLLENGKRGIPKPTILKKMAPVYNVPYEELLEKAGIIENKDFVYTPPEDPSPLTSFVREFSKMDKDEQQKTMQELLSIIINDDKDSKKDKKKK